VIVLQVNVAGIFANEFECGSPITSYRHSELIFIVNGLLTISNTILAAPTRS
jgi:hypothetical protein